MVLLACISSSSPITCMHTDMVCSTRWHIGRCMAAYFMGGSMCTAYRPLGAAVKALKCESVQGVMLPDAICIASLPHVATALQGPD